MPGLYVHIPFCVRKCVYCDFYSLPTAQGPLARRVTAADQPDQPDFLRALERELESLPDEFRPETVFLGGGTPTELSLADLRELLNLLHRHVDLGAVREWTCESNPGTLAEAKVEVLLSAGVNRLSLGVQSFDPATLEFLGRIHSADEAREGFRLLRGMGVRNLNLDLIYGVPGSSRDAVARDLDALLELGPDHAACYCLIFEDGTPLNDLRNRGFVKEVDDDTELDQYNLVRDRLCSAGYEHYEISNFARPGFRCAHNLLYWGAGEYLGVGPSAHSHWRGVRSGNVRDLAAYTRRLLGGHDARAFREQLDPEAKARETLVMALRRLDGITAGEFRATTGFAYEELCREQLPWLRGEGLLDDAGGRLRLTERGLFVSDAIFAELV
jgi:oxygen-independent coproporphyrinogen-3 oxidase